MKVTLEGKVALVTGGGTGIGKAIVDAFGALGAKVVVAEISKGKCASLAIELEEKGIDHLVVETDVREVGQVEALKRQIEERYGRLDILVNNVGHHLNIFKKLVDSTEEEWQAIYDINLRHMFIVSRAMIPLIQRSGEGGSIINFSSIEGFRGFPYNILYTTFKHAVTGFTKGLAIELSTDRIRVNLIAPETTDSEQCPLDQVLLPEHREQANGTIPLGRFGRPEDHAWAAVYLASDMASWVTGTTMLVDGGGHAGNVFQRTPDGQWTNMPIVVGKAHLGG